MLFYLLIYCKLVVIVYDQSDSGWSSFAITFNVKQLFWYRNKQANDKQVSINGTFYCCWENWKSTSSPLKSVTVSKMLRLNYSSDICVYIHPFQSGSGYHSFLSIGWVMEPEIFDPGLNLNETGGGKRTVNWG